MWSGRRTFSRDMFLYTICSKRRRQLTHLRLSLLCPPVQSKTNTTPILIQHLLPRWNSPLRFMRGTKSEMDDMGRAELTHIPHPHRQLSHLECRF